MNSHLNNSSRYAIDWWIAEISSNTIMLDIAHKIGARRGSRNRSAITADPAIIPNGIAVPNTTLNQNPESRSSRVSRCVWTMIAGRPKTQSIAANSVTTVAMATYP